ncbi:MAG: FliI/YscN family ATPase [Pseudomonadota bacterium]
MDLVRLEAELRAIPQIWRCGRIVAADGASIRIAGLGSKARIGDQVRLAPDPKAEGPTGEIIALSEGEARAMILDPTQGVAVQDLVWLIPEPELRPSEAWVGRVIDAFGRPLDDKPLANGLSPVDIRATAPRATRRARLGEQVATGLAVTDTLLPLAKGQRIGIFAGSGVGKSQLLSGLARGVDADIVVFALIGERGRDLLEFLDQGLGPEARARSVVVAATSDQSALLRRRALWSAMAVSEFFRDQGKHVLLIVDSLTRFAEAHREIALTAGEPPTLRAFPPSTTNLIANVTERAGPGEVGQGAITAIFSVLVAGSDMEEPVADITRGLLDGHIVLEREIAERGRFPAIDAVRSVSRSLPGVVGAEHLSLINRARGLLSAYEKARPMIQTGLYVAGSDPGLDAAIDAFDGLDSFIAEQAKGGPARSFQRLSELLNGDVGTSE